MSNGVLQIALLGSLLMAWIAVDQVKKHVC
jgi:hypothetical protein